MPLLLLLGLNSHRADADFGLARWGEGADLAEGDGQGGEVGAATAGDLVENTHTAVRGGRRSTEPAADLIAGTRPRFTSAEYLGGERGVHLVQRVPQRSPRERLQMFLAG